jgi:hypothetical protein
MKISDGELRGYAAAALVGIVMSKGAGNPEANAKQAVKQALAMRKELEALKGEDDYAEEQRRKQTAT